MGLLTKQNSIFEGELLKWKWKELFFFFAVSCLGRSTAMNQASDKSWEVFWTWPRSSSSSRSLFFFCRAESVPPGTPSTIHQINLQRPGLRNRRRPTGSPVFPLTYLCIFPLDCTNMLLRVHSRAVCLFWPIFCVRVLQSMGEEDGMVYAGDSH